jgi:ATP-dependent Lhr-like helicase
MSSPTSGSEPSSPERSATSAAFELLDPRLQRWVYDEGWQSLRAVQEKAIPLLIDASHDVILSATTASGKTEAAFLPILSNLVMNPERALGAQVLCVSPLKALIDDQFFRLEDLCAPADVAVHRWHGDVTATAKTRFTTHPSGVLVITPESLEALFVLRGDALASMFAGLRYVVVDELHAFVGTQRGAQLQSLLHRLDLVLGRSPVRVGLSATIGNVGVATAFLRPSAPETVKIVDCSDEPFDVRLQVRGYVNHRPAATGGAEAPTGDAIFAVTDDLYRTLRGSNNLVFANARARVEQIADILTQRSAREHLPNEFWPHHGNLSREVRDDAESRLRDAHAPATVICTSTLELGIDIGAVSSVAQVGAPPSVAVLRQRTGRSGRRGEPAVLRLYSTVDELTSSSDIVDELRWPLVQSIAMVNLMLNRWLDSPTHPSLNLSTLVQQTMSVLVQHGGARADQLHRILCGPGPFGDVGVADYARLLRAMAGQDLITQEPTGLLLVAGKGERMASHFSFYAVFESPKEWRVTTGGRTLGTLSPLHPPTVGDFLIFAGRRWSIDAVDADAEVIDVTPAPAGKLPTFDAGPIPMSNAARDAMVAAYEGADEPPWLDSTARQLICEARAAWRRADLSRNTVLGSGAPTIVLPWVGDQALDTARLILQSHDIVAELVGPALYVKAASPGNLAAVASRVLAGEHPDALELAALMGRYKLDKWDWVLDDDLLIRANAARCIDMDGALTVFRRISEAPLPG